MIKAELKSVRGSFENSYFLIKLHLEEDEFECPHPFGIVLQMPASHYSHLKDPEKILSQIVKRINTYEVMKEISKKDIIDKED
jgi:hypothetical protein